MMGNVRGWVEFSTEAVRLADQVDNPELQSLARLSQGYGLYCVGRLADSVACAERGEELTGGDPNVGVALIGFSCLVHHVYIRALFLVDMGRIDEAEHMSARGIQLCHEYNEMQLLGWVLGDTIRISYYTYEPQRALTNARKVVEIAEKLGTEFSRGLAYGWLGIAHVLAEEWTQAVEMLEKTLEVTQRTAREREAEFLAWLGEAYLGVGDANRARKTVKDAVALAHQRGALLQECMANISLARVLLSTDGADARAEIETGLQRALDLVEEIDAALQEAFIRVELAELARLTGDADTRERELREAHRLFTDMGAPNRAKQVEALLQDISSAEGSN